MSSELSLSFFVFWFYTSLCWLSCHPCFPLPRAAPHLSPIPLATLVKKENLVFQHFLWNSWIHWLWMIWFWLNPHSQPWRRYSQRKSGSLRKTLILFPQRGERSKSQAGKNSKYPTLPSSYVVGFHVNKFLWGPRNGKWTTCMNLIEKQISAHLEKGPFDNQNH